MGVGGVDPLKKELGGKYKKRRITIATWEL